MVSLPEPARPALPGSHTHWGPGPWSPAGDLHQGSAPGEEETGRPAVKGSPCRVPSPFFSGFAAPRSRGFCLPVWKVLPPGYLPRLLPLPQDARGLSWPLNTAPLPHFMDLFKMAPSKKHMYLFIFCMPPARLLCSRAPSTQNSTWVMLNFCKGILY